MAAVGDERSMRVRLWTRAVGEVKSWMLGLGPDAYLEIRTAYPRDARKDMQRATDIRCSNGLEHRPDRPAPDRREIDRSISVLHWTKWKFGEFGLRERRRTAGRLAFHEVPPI
jgi:hypothetical protein